MIKIKINGKEVQSLQPITTVTSVDIVVNGMFRHLVPRPQAKGIADFVWDCCQKCTGVIMYNNTIVQKEDVTKAIF